MSVTGQPLWYVSTDDVTRELHLVDQQLGGILGGDSTSPDTKDLSDRYVISSLMEEAIASSRIEGASTVHRIAKEMLRRNRTPRDTHERMILNNYRAINWIRGHKDADLTPSMLLELQRMLTEGTLERPDEC
ncbi:MAG: hypothetical protein AAGB48_01255 [Planctomycetota bacterium]